MADSFLKKFKNLVLGKKESKEVVSSIKDFNKVTSSYLEVLSQQVDQKKKKVNSVRVLVQQMFPKKKLQSGPQFNIQLIDMGNTKMTSRGKGSESKQMDWEKKLREINRKNRGTLI